MGDRVNKKCLCWVQDLREIGEGLIGKGRREGWEVVRGGNDIFILLIATKSEYVVGRCIFRGGGFGGCKELIRCKMIK